MAEQINKRWCTHTCNVHMHTHLCTYAHTHARTQQKERLIFLEFLSHPETILKSLILRHGLGNAMMRGSSLFIEWGLFALREPETLRGEAMKDLR